MNGELIIAAQKARANAYAPYSHYKVGAAILGADGNIYTGCNVENASYGLTLCAERNAIGAMVSAGCAKAAACAVATQNANFPCGACLQVVCEFAEDGDDFQIFLIDATGCVKQFSLNALFPHGFAF